MEHSSRAHRALSLVGVTLFIVSFLVSPPLRAQSPEAERGALLYRIYCISCHGESAEGDGPMSEILTVKPADLTGLASRNDGTFPKHRVHLTIDGRQEVRGHGTRHMPIWGLAFQQLDKVSGGEEEEVQSRIEALLAYLRSIQK